MTELDAEDLSEYPSLGRAPAVRPRFVFREVAFRRLWCGPHLVDIQING